MPSREGSASEPKAFCVRAARRAAEVQGWLRVLGLGQSRAMHAALSLWCHAQEPEALCSSEDKGTTPGCRRSRANSTSSSWAPGTTLGERTRAKHPGETQLPGMGRNPGDHRGKKLTCRGKRLSRPSAACGGEQQRRGENAEPGGDSAWSGDSACCGDSACSDATPAPREGWARSHRAPKHPADQPSSPPSRPHDARLSSTRLGERGGHQKK